MLLDRVNRLAESVRKFFKNSILIGLLSRAPSEELHGAYQILSDTKRMTANRMYGVWQIRFRRRMLQWQEQSVWRRLFRSFWVGFLQSQVSAVGVFLLVFSGVALLRNWLTGFPTLTSAGLLVPLGLVLSAVPLLLSAESCSEAIRSSRLLSGFLIGFCGLPESQFGSFEVGRERRGISLLLGLLFGLISIPVHPVYVLVFLFILLFCILAFTVPELPLFALFLLFPFFEWLPHPTLMLAGYLVLCTFVWLGKTVSGKRQAEFGFTDCLVLLLLLLFATTAAVGAGLRSEGLLRAFLLLSAWFPARGLLATKKWQVRCIRTLLFSSLVCSAYGIWQYVAGKATLAWVDLSRFSDIGGRVCSFFDNPNILAVFLLLTLPLAPGALIGCQSIQAAILSFFSLSAGVLCLILTWSRGAWLGLIAAVTVFLLLHGKRSLSVLFLLPIPTVAAGLYLPHNLLNRFSSIGQLTESSSQYRLYTWRGTLRMILAHPFGIGCGEDAFHLVYSLHAVSGTESVMHAHQLFLQIAAELGIVGLVCFVWILFRLLRRELFYLKRTKNASARAWSLGLFCALLGTLVMGLFDYVWYRYSLFWLFWGLCAVLMNVTQERREE